MLPHILHSTTRAVAVVQNQSHAIRNVLQLQSSGPSSGSGSSWGNGPGPGGSKFNTGSRFYSGYNSAGRAVTQANVLTSHDGNFTQTDEAEDFVSRRSVHPAPPKRHRMRSSSVSLTGTGRNERGEKMGVLKTVQLHARSNHAFAPVETMASAKERLLSDSVAIEDSGSRPLLIRRNSTSAPLSPLLNASELPPPSPPTPPLELRNKRDRRASVTSAAPSKDEKPPAPTQQTATPPPSPKDVAKDFYVGKFDGFAHQDADQVHEYVQRLLTTVEKPSVEQFNAALRALNRSRQDGEALVNIIRLYNKMLDKSVVPNVVTYETLIYALTTRDMEVHQAIVSLEVRLKQRPLVERFDTTSAELDNQRITKLKEEDNFGSAMSLFESILAIGGREKLHADVFTHLLRSCAFHANVDAAIHVFAQLERNSHMHIDYSVYRYMIAAFSKSGRIEQAEEIFSEFLKGYKKGRIRLYPMKALHVGRREQLKVWNTMMEAYFRAEMPDKAVGILERMLSSKAGNEYAPDDVPVVTSSTFTTVITGFLQAGDIQSALTWFDRLLVQPQAGANPYEGIGGEAMRPDGVAWNVMLDALALHGRIDDMNRLYKILKATHKEDRLFIRSVDQLIVYSANMENLKNLDDASALDILHFILEDLSTTNVGLGNQSKIILDICEAFAARGEYVIPAELINKHFVEKLQYYDGAPPLVILQGMQGELQALTGTICRALEQGKGELPFRSAFTIAQIHRALNMMVEAGFAPVYLHSYGRARFLNLLPYEELTVDDWNMLLSYAVQIETSMNRGDSGVQVPADFAFNGVVSLLQDIASQNMEFYIIDAELRKRTVELLQSQHGEMEVKDVLARVGPSYVQALTDLEHLKYSALQSALVQDSENEMQTDGMRLPVTEYPSLTINSQLSRAIQDGLRGPSHSVDHRLSKAWGMFQKGLQRGHAPQAPTIAALIQGFGRLGDLEKVRELYTVGQSVVATVYPEQQVNSWTQIEDSMIVALAHSGNVDAAHVHRLRILEQGQAPSADAYGVLIQHVKDTTDDTSGAMSLFQEAIERGVQPNLYLYNNIISKLSKARKADYALELFHQMKAVKILPSSITYGAVIGACARVGDISSAESLFQEMIHARGFKPRVPPYNTMMQLYTTTKPNRNRALFFYNEMLAAGIKPSAHTYKLLLDTYGSLEPVDLQSMEEVYKTLQEDPSVQLTGGHFASLINAYGCVSKDFDKAIALFESIHTIPNAPAVDAVVFEAVINVIVAHRRTDLLPVYVNKMNEAGVHMTAYIANFLIKGYANVGDLDRAREIFESLSDPATGMAAPNNHAPHNPAESVEILLMDRVYREPSTWEVMVRAELGAGNRDAAKDLLERLRARQYPEAVYNRISGVMTDHSVPL
ncbi:hypothetical protein B0H34DRAFT_212843 [Crassisporium funariophilum]|nr:hypothetical protein B0H34DRAFT_212843 [Crassisporium funariophilum]